VSLKKFENKINNYERKISDKINQSKKTSLYSISLIIIVSIVIIILLLNWLKPIWFTLFKIKLRNLI
tara:strand:+ start:126 stop:326 length:201 start_codon:yes stop_codon:yes gene_type:complete